MTTLFGFPAPENQAEYCSLCSDCGDERLCPCKTYDEADEETKKAMSEAIDEEINSKYW